MDSPVKRASIFGALFCLALPLYAATGCEPRHEPERHRVRYVYDGDSLKLTDNRKIRLIGINTPEMARDTTAAEPLADKARQFLLSEIKRANNEVGLIYGKERKDRYGRTLAHIFLPDDTNLAAMLLREGLGSHVAITPNISYVECYRAAQQEARSRKLNLWQDESRTVINLDQNNQIGTGFHHISGTVTNITNTKRNTLLDIGDTVAIQIAHNDLKYFKINRQQPLASLKGTYIEVSGWIYPVKDRYRLRVYHPSILYVLH